jgi:hypothetical protein
MTTVIFVHGTGVRKEDYEQSFAQVKGELTKRQANLNVLPCYWGELGTQLNAKGASIPQYNSTRNIFDAVTDEEYLISLWGVLYQDPLYELRLLSLRTGKPGEFIPGQLPPGKQLRKSVDELPLVSEMSGKQSDLREKLTQGGIASVFDRARQEITGTSLFDEAIESAPKELGEYRTATARAIVAQAILMCEQEGKMSLIATNADLRDEVVELLMAALGDSSRGVIGYLTKPITWPLIRIGTYYAKRNRGALIEKTSNAVGDILLYQARGEKIRASIHETIQAVQEPVVLLAHSLGGIMSVDLLIKENLPQVKLLVTAGSQSPYFYEINALQSLAFKDIPANERLPAHFPTWLNVYDHGDFLSYIGAGVFGSKVIDFEVNNRQPFPRSHSAYWSNSVMWNEVIKKIKMV